MPFKKGKKYCKIYHKIKKGVKSKKSKTSIFQFFYFFLKIKLCLLFRSDLGFFLKEFLKNSDKISLFFAANADDRGILQDSKNVKS
jgi:hypothetical protein